MSDSETETEAPRRSQRERKPAKPFQSAGAISAGKRKRGDDSDSDAPGSNAGSADADASGDEDDAEEDGEEFISKAAKPKGTPRPRKKKAETADAGAPAPKRRAKADGTPAKPPAARRGRKKGIAAEGAAGGAELAKELPISGDNALFNTLLNPSAALQSTVDDLCDSLTASPAPAIADIVNCILRSCGCNDVVDADAAVDYDGVVDSLDNFTESLKQEDTPMYPLTSKLPVFKKFRKALDELLSRLVRSAADSGVLYSTELMVALTTWVTAMSSSQIRSFRHTASVIGLELCSALCDVAAGVEKEQEVNSRAREGEKKRRAGKAAVSGAREKQFEAKAEALRANRDQLKEWIKDIVDSVFIHRYRDTDPAIRTECVQAMGQWLKRYPAHFLGKDNFLPYIGWVLSDASTAVRLASVRALDEAYAHADHVAALTHFTERFKARLAEIAARDADVGVRTAVVRVLARVDEGGLLEDAQRGALCLLVFDEEPRVRAAVAGFVAGVWKEAAEERAVGRELGAREARWVGMKALAGLLVQWGRELDKTEQADDGGGALPAGVDAEDGRIPLAVDALWDAVAAVGQWEDMLELLLLDHSADAPAAPARGRKKGAKAPAAVDDAWRLDDAEEGALLEVLVAALRHVGADAAAAKKGEGEEAVADMTRALIKGLPALFVKHQADESRIIHILQIPEIMALDLYLELRMMTAYTNLWTDITKQFLSHSSPAVLAQAVRTILHLLSAHALSNANGEKARDLEDELATQLRDAIGGRDELAMVAFGEDELAALGAACARVAALGARRDLTAWADEDAGGKQSAAWDILAALAERGRLGYKEEERMVQAALQALGMHVLWKAQRVSVRAPGAEDAAFRERLVEQRGVLLDKVTEFALGTRSNTVEAVKQEAFQTLMTLHVLFAPGSPIAEEVEGEDETTALALSLDDETQYRCAGFVQAEIERYAEHLATLQPEKDAGGEESGSGSDTEGEAPKPKKKGRKKKTVLAPEEPVSDNLPPAALQEEYRFIRLVSSFLQAVVTSSIGIRHSAVLLAHYGRLGDTYDVCVKPLIEVLREEALFQENGALVADIMVQALSESFTLVMEGTTHAEEPTVALAKALAPCFVLRGAQLAIVRRLEGTHVVHVHTALLTWLGKRLAAAEAAKNRSARNTAALFFRALTPLLVVALDARDALKIKAHMDQVLAQAKIAILPTSKVWDGQRAYERKLGTAASKSRAKGTRGKQSKTAEVVTTEDDEPMEDVAEKPKKTAPKPRPRRAAAVRTTRARKAEVDADEEEDAEADADADADGDADPDIHLTPPATPPVRAARPRRGAKPAAAAASPPPRPDSLPPSSPLSQSSAATPRKRARPAEEEDEEDVGAAPASPALSDASQYSEVILKRKRARH